MELGNDEEEMGSDIWIANGNEDADADADDDDDVVLLQGGPGAHEDDVFDDSMMGTDRSGLGGAGLGNSFSHIVHMQSENHATDTTWHDSDEGCDSWLVDASSTVRRSFGREAGEGDHGGELQSMLDDLPPPGGDDGGGGCSSTSHSGSHRDGLRSSPPPHNLGAVPWHFSHKQQENRQPLTLDRKNGTDDTLQIDRLKALLRGKDRLLGEQQDVIAILRRQLEEACDERDRAARVGRDWKAQTETVESDNAQLKEDLAQSSSTISALRNQAQDLQTQLSNAHSSIEELHSRIRGLESGDIVMTAAKYEAHIQQVTERNRLDLLAALEENDALHHQVQELTDELARCAREAPLTPQTCDAGVQADTPTFPIISADVSIDVCSSAGSCVEAEMQALRSTVLALECEIKSISVMSPSAAGNQSPIEEEKDNSSTSSSGTRREKSMVQALQKEFKDIQKLNAELINSNRGLMAAQTKLLQTDSQNKQAAELSASSSSVEEEKMKAKAKWEEDIRAETARIMAECEKDKLLAVQAAVEAQQKLAAGKEQQFQANKEAENKRLRAAWTKNTQERIKAVEERCSRELIEALEKQRVELQRAPQDENSTHHIHSRNQTDDMGDKSRSMIDSSYKTDQPVHAGTLQTSSGNCEVGLVKRDESCTKEVYVAITLDMKFSELEKMDLFAAEVTADVCRAVGIEENRVKMGEILAGSVIVHIVIGPSSRFGNSNICSCCVVHSLREQCGVRGSKLMTGVHTCKTTSVKEIVESIGSEHSESATTWLSSTVASIDDSADVRTVRSSSFDFSVQVALGSDVARYSNTVMDQAVKDRLSDETQRLEEETQTQIKELRRIKLLERHEKLKKVRHEILMETQQAAALLKKESKAMRVEDAVPPLQVDVSGDDTHDDSRQIRKDAPDMVDKECLTETSQLHEEELRQELLKLEGDHTEARIRALSDATVLYERQLQEQLESLRAEWERKRINQESNEICKLEASWQREKQLQEEETHRLATWKEKMLEESRVCQEELRRQIDKETKELEDTLKSLQLAKDEYENEKEAVIVAAKSELQADLAEEIELEISRIGEANRRKLQEHIDKQEAEMQSKLTELAAATDKQLAEDKAKLKAVASSELKDMECRLLEADSEKLNELRKRLAEDRKSASSRAIDNAIKAALCVRTQTQKILQEELSKEVTSVRVAHENRSREAISALKEELAAAEMAMEADLRRAFDDRIQSLKTELEMEEEEEKRMLRHGFAHTVELACEEMREKADQEMQEERSLAATKVERYKQKIDEDLQKQRKKLAADYKRREEELRTKMDHDIVAMREQIQKETEEMLEAVRAELKLAAVDCDKLQDQFEKDLVSSLSRFRETAENDISKHVHDSEVSGVRNRKAALEELHAQVKSENTSVLCELLRKCCAHREKQLADLCSELERQRVDRMKQARMQQDAKMDEVLRAAAARYEEHRQAEVDRVQEAEKEKTREAVVQMREEMERAQQDALNRATEEFDRENQEALSQEQEDQKNRLDTALEQLAREMKKKREEAVSNAADEVQAKTDRLLEHLQKQMLSEKERSVRALRKKCESEYSSRLMEIQSLAQTDLSNALTQCRSRSCVEQAAALEALELQLSSERETLLADIRNTAVQQLAADLAKAESEHLANKTKKVQRLTLELQEECRIAVDSLRANMERESAEAEACLHDSLQRDRQKKMDEVAARHEKELDKVTNELREKLEKGREGALRALEFQLLEKRTASISTVEKECQEELSRETHRMEEMYLKIRAKRVDQMRYEQERELESQERELRLRAELELARELANLRDECAADVDKTRAVMAEQEEVESRPAFDRTCTAHSRRLRDLKLATDVEIKRERAVLLTSLREEWRIMLDTRFSLTSSDETNLFRKREVRLGAELREARAAEAEALKRCAGLEKRLSAMQDERQDESHEDELHRAKAAEAQALKRCVALEKRIVEMRDEDEFLRTAVADLRNRLDCLRVEGQRESEARPAEGVLVVREHGGVDLKEERNPAVKEMVSAFHHLVQCALTCSREDQITISTLQEELTDLLMLLIKPCSRTPLLSATPSESASPSGLSLNSTLVHMTPSGQSGAGRRHPDSNSKMSSDTLPSARPSPASNRPFLGSDGHVISPVIQPQRWGRASEGGHISATSSRHDSASKAHAGPDREPALADLAAASREWSALFLRALGAGGEGRTGSRGVASPDYLTPRKVRERDALWRASGGSGSSGRAPSPMQERDRLLFSLLRRSSTRRSLTPSFNTSRARPAAATEDD